MAQRGHTGEGPYQYQVGSGGKYDKPGFTGGPTSSGNNMDYHNPPPKGVGGIQEHWAGGGYL